MMKYQTKHVEVEAVQWTGDNIEEVRKLIGNNFLVGTESRYSSIIVKAAELTEDGGLYFDSYAQPIHIGWYIVKYPNGAIQAYPAWDAFAQVFEPINN